MSRLAESSLVEPVMFPWMPTEHGPTYSKPNRCPQAPNAPGDRIPVTRILQSGSPVTSCTNDSSHGRNALILSLNSSSPGEKILSVRIENEKRIDDACLGISTRSEFSRVSF